MKKKFILLTLISLFLSACTPSSSSEVISSSSEYSSSETSSSEESSSQESSSGETSSSSEASSSEDSSSSLPSSSEENEVTYNVKYALSAYDEPMMNEQLITFNPLSRVHDVLSYYRGDNIKVAVIDSGFDIDHPDFKTIDNETVISDDSVYINSDNNGKITRQVGKNYVKITDGDSHGTMCAGLLGARVNGVGMSGIAPRVTLMLIKIDKKAYSMADAFKYAADNGARVISTSLGAYPSSTGSSYGDIHFPSGLDLSKVFNNNIKYAYDKGVTIVAATGNDKNTKLSYPAGCDYVIGAGGLAAGSNTKIWDNGGEGSNYNGNSVYVDCFAPSEGIVAPGFDTSKNASTYWRDAKGTSFAAPIIAGAAALYFEKYPNKSNVDFENALRNSCNELSSHNNNKNMGYGGLNVAKLLNINEDIIEIDSFNGTSKKSVEVTRLNVIDEAGWNFRTLHVYGFKFEDGYGFSSLERYFEYMYGKRISTNSYTLEGTKRGYAYTDEDYVGDYYLCLGNNANGIATTYEYIFPSFVKEFYYQIVNNNHWLPDGGEHVAPFKGHLNTINSYFWSNNGSFGVSSVVDDKLASHSFDTINVKVYELNGEVETSINNSQVFAFEKFKYDNKELYFDKNMTKGYISSYLSNDTNLYYRG